MDKTGTLTTGTMSVESQRVAEGVDPEQFWSFLVAVESSSSHPIAQALIAHRPEITKQAASNAVTHAGFGVSATVAGKEVLAGRAAWLSQQKVSVPAELAEEFARASEHTAVWLAVDGVLWGGVYLADQPKPQSAATIADLQRRGYHVVLLTGDAEAADPVCSKSEHHHLVEEAVRKAQVPDAERTGRQPMIFRDPKESRRLSCKS